MSDRVLGPIAIGEQLAGMLGGGKTSRTPGIRKVWFGDVARTRQPVRRRSYHVGDRESTVWRRIADGSRREGKRFAGAMLLAARRHDIENRQPGKENGPIGHIGHEVLRALLDLVDFRTGRLEPSIDTLMERLRRSRNAVCRALARLRDAGFIDWIRRTIPVEDPDPFGPQVKQTSNAYGFDVERLPEKARQLVKAIMRKGPPPEADTWGAEAPDTVTRMLDPIPASEIGSALDPGSEWAVTIDSLGAALERSWARESTENRAPADPANASSRDARKPGMSIRK